MIKSLSLESNYSKVDLKNREIGIKRIEDEENRSVKIWNIPRKFIEWLQRLKEAFGSPFMAVVIIVYGVSEGYVGTVRGLATNYYWKDVQKLQPSSTQAFQVKHLLVSFLSYLRPRSWQL